MQPGACCFTRFLQVKRFSGGWSERSWPALQHRSLSQQPPEEELRLHESSCEYLNAFVLNSSLIYLLVPVSFHVQNRFAPKVRNISRVQMHSLHSCLPAPASGPPTRTSTYFIGSAVLNARSVHHIKHFGPSPAKETKQTSKQTTQHMSAPRNCRFYI